jgi:hypothetical protein
MVRVLRQSAIRGKQRHLASGSGKGRCGREIHQIRIEDHHRRAAQQNEPDATSPTRAAKLAGSIGVTKILSAAGAKSITYSVAAFL